MLDKLRAIWEYIRNNNVWEDIKGRYLNLLQWLKWRQWIGDAWHKKVMGKLMEYKKYNPLVRPIGEKPVSDWPGVQAEADRMYAKDMNKHTQAPDLEYIKQRKADDVMFNRWMLQRDKEEYNQKALNQF